VAVGIVETRPDDGGFEIVVTNHERHTAEIPKRAFVQAQKRRELLIPDGFFIAVTRVAKRHPEDPGATPLSRGGLERRRPLKEIDLRFGPRRAVEDAHGTSKTVSFQTPADARSHSGILEETTAENDSRGPGSGGGVGKGTGTGIGEGTGTGVGAGSGGGTGGGVYRPGSGIEPPKLLHEVKPVYTEDARLTSARGRVVMEIVVRRDGSVGDLRIIRGLGAD
jgi:outer membrane biosynthesis protein TonB